jgi:hypothetical protein
MNPTRLWLWSFVLGAGNALLTGLAGVIFGGLFFALALPLAIRGDRWVVLSGLLTGFGGTWLVLLDREASSGGELDDASAWVALGVVAFVLGLLPVIIKVIRGRPSGVEA